MAIMARPEQVRNTLETICLLFRSSIVVNSRIVTVIRLDRGREGKLEFEDEDDDDYHEDD